MLNLDTHIVVHAMVGRLSRKETTLLRANPWSISAIVLWEIAKLSQLGRVEIDLGDREVRRFIGQFHVWPITLDIVRAASALDFRSDPADELIAATSIVHAVPLVTRDRRILKSKTVPLAV